MSGALGGEFAFDCLTDSCHGAYHGDAVEFGWQGNDEMEPANVDGWAELQDDCSLEGEICLLNGGNMASLTPSHHLIIKIDGVELLASTKS